MAASKEVIEDDIQYESLEDFFQDFREANESCEVILIDLEHRPDDVDLLNGLFRVVHTTKGNLIYVGLSSITPLMQSLEDLLDYIRNGHLQYDSILCDVILLSLDKTKQMVEAKLNQSESPLSEETVDKICGDINLIVDASPEKRLELFNDVLRLLDPSACLRDATGEQVMVSQENVGDEPSDETVASTPPLNQPSNQPTIEEYQSQLIEMMEKYDIEIDEDIRYFASLVKPLEDRSRYWHGRALRQLFVCLEMNREMGSPVNEAQLAVAVMLHDIGMSFMPLEMLDKKGPLTSCELKILHYHPDSGYLLLNESARWHDAAIIIRQHHEQMDGSGYPCHLHQDEICDGAKIISIADTFEARTHERAHHTLLKRPLMRCKVEINNYKGTQFDEQWVDIFNKIAEVHFKSEENLP